MQTESFEAFWRVTADYFRYREHWLLDANSLSFLPGAEQDDPDPLGLIVCKRGSALIVKLNEAELRRRLNGRSVSSGECTAEFLCRCIDAVVQSSSGKGKVKLLFDYERGLIQKYETEVSSESQIDDLSGLIESSQTARSRTTYKWELKSVK